MDLSQYTKTELLKISNDLIQYHNEIKEKVLIKTDMVEELKNEINDLISDLNDAEELYIKISKEIEK